MQTKNSLPNLANGSTIIYGCIVGLYAQGLSSTHTKRDKKWIFVQSTNDVFINGYKPFIIVNDGEVAYELSKFLKLAVKANPTVLEMLFASEDCVLYKDALFDKVLTRKKEFLTKTCKFSFSGQIVNQIEQAISLKKKIDLLSKRMDRKSVLDFCYFITNTNESQLKAKFQSQLIKEKFFISQILQMGLSEIPNTKCMYNIFEDYRYSFKGIVRTEQLSKDVLLSDIPEDANCVGMLYFDKDAYTTYCNEYEGLLKIRSIEEDIDPEDDERKIIKKSLFNAIRLIETARSIAEYKELVIKSDNVAYLKEIIFGKHDLGQLIAYTQHKIEVLNRAFAESTLPKGTDEVAASLKMINFQIRKEIAARSKALIYK